MQGILIVGALVALYLSLGQQHTSLVEWDAKWYDSIRANGYEFKPRGMSNAGFFPLLPVVWRMLSLNALGMSLLNMGLAITAMWLLRRYLQIRLTTLWLYSALPSVMFLYLPYTEALFFLSSSLVLISLAYSQRVGQGAAMLMGALTRVTAIFYLPALVVVEAVAAWQEPRSFWVRARRIVPYGALTGLGLVSVMVYQWSQTGVWFAYSKAQSLGWDHHLRLTKVPFISASNSILWLDGLAFLTGISAGLWACWKLLLVVLRDKQEAPTPAELFSAVFLGTATVHAVLFASVGPEGNTSLISMHRYVFGTPFFLVLLNKFLPTQAPSWRSALRLLVPIAIITGLLGMLSKREFVIQLSPVGPVPGLLYALFVLVYGSMWVVAGTRWGRVLLYGCSLLMQMAYLWSFSVGRWVG
ncbi:hypothetical protein [Hymenobacter sp. BT491]|uniref:hypothetical protein n=1 Tax=Hymenobacter sp. BT491 TaxID=2766779 RepID=UPI0016535A43|nr:hypothetical protein [Hymenobacter sp. BT491]MBC6991072.1 hypothetical protein [Hymenobacter sp. BT491]